MEATGWNIRSWLTRERAIGYASILALTELGLFALCVAGAHGLIVKLDHQTSTDFVSFYAAGALADAGTPWLAYDRAAHHAAEQAAASAEIPYNYFYYPPVFLLLCAGLARLPYLLAFVLFQMAGATVCFLAVRLIRRDLPPVVFLAFPALWWAIGTGQNALLTAALFAAGTALTDRRPWLSGLCFGALCYKPHLGLLVPVALIAGGHWRVVLGAAGTVLALAGTSAAVFGAVTWEAFLQAAMSPGEVYGSQAIFMGGLTSPYGVAMMLGAGRTVAIAAQAVAILFAAGVVAQVWRGNAALPARAAVLLAATPIAVPVLMFYDLMLVFVALVWLSRVRYAAPWTRAAMAVVFVLPLFSGNLATETHWMVAAIAAGLAFGVTLAAIWPEVGLPRRPACRPPLTRVGLA